MVTYEGLAARVLGAADAQPPKGLDLVWAAPAATIVVALIAAFVAWYVPAWKMAREARLDAARALRHTRDPLLRAAYDLQSRLYNVVARDFLQRYLRNGSAAEREYAVMSTLWLVAQFLGWVEVLRREVQYLDLGTMSANRRLQRSLNQVSAALASDSQRLSDAFVIFRADQRAIGEFMVRTHDRGTAGLRMDCFGYSEFAREIARASAAPPRPWWQRRGARPDALSTEVAPVAAWVSRYREDLERQKAVPETIERLVDVQRRLVDLVDLLDPSRVRYPEVNHRGRLPGTATYAPRSTFELARFLWRKGSPWPLVETWRDSLDWRAVGEVSDTQRIYQSRRGLTGVSTRVAVAYENDWVTIAACRRRRHRRSVDGSLRSSRSRVALNRLLRAFDRPVVIHGSTYPARIAWFWVRTLRRLR